MKTSWVDSVGRWIAFLYSTDFIINFAILTVFIWNFLFYIYLIYYNYY